MTPEREDLPLTPLERALVKALIRVLVRAATADSNVPSEHTEAVCR